VSVTEAIEGAIMTIARYQRDEFAEHLKTRTIIDYPGLDDFVDWIRDNLEPEEVFSETRLESWAETNGRINVDNMDPEDVFGAIDLQDWAERNGYTKEKAAA
jgi:hypothetical protein